MADRRQTLLEVGRRRFIAAGYAATSIDEICRGAGVTKGGFFHYFATKEAFAQDVLADTWDRFLEAHAELDDFAAVAAIERHVSFMVGFIAADGRVIPRLAQELGPANPEVRAQVQGYFATWTDRLRAMLERAGSEEPDSLMEFIIAGIEGAPMVAAQLGEQVLDHTVAHLVAHVHAQLGTS